MGNSLKPSLTIDTHTRWEIEAGNNIDPDHGNSRFCNACRLPIFSTPLVTTTALLLHDQCAFDHLPPKLKAHPLHPREELTLHQRSTTILDLACALTIKILHRSHEHRLTAIRGTSCSFICAACGTQHDRAAPPGFKIRYGHEMWDLSYMCSPCDFWIHPDCALLPNAIIIERRHGHPLLLTYLAQGVFKNEVIWPRMPTAIVCSICHGESEGFGFYACFHCRYYAHIKCAIYSSDPDHISFKPVLLRDAQVPNFLRLPMTNEHTSVMPCFITDQTTITSTGGDRDRDCDGGATTSGSKLILFEDDRVHEHPLILHDHHHNPLLTTTAASASATHDDDDVARVCSACVQLISSTDGPFYSCANNNNNNNKLAGPCRDFFLHRCCAHLPATLITQHGAHGDNNSHPLTLLSKQDMHSHFINMFFCDGCHRACNGFAYAYEEHGYYLDVVCAFMSSALISHDAHAKSHILRALMGDTKKRCICCGQDIGARIEIGYECNNCRNFSIHAKCALLPDTVTHKFDRHPLKLITTTTTLDHHRSPVVSDQKEEEDMFCEICEKDMDDALWYYGCKKCGQSFHIDCIPTLDKLSRIKFGFTSTARVPGHNCPLACVRALSIDGYTCVHCERVIRESEAIAFECSECYFRIHKLCARELLIPEKLNK
ncbi:hypothetical protein PHJA_001110400 [Phtheirospermum japonicum]|uniref:Phorbol-ester/DAG-type domain-containing protein n=1 Tax=Phtheirospermum japonicum TaxID=374723 RepID=A0A830BS28_9LAMI|nr:hypothetical protein PHJA_001110400 [Phtheirospermum japonicum]